MVSTYVVTGMSCEHCVHSVSSELNEIDGVTGVEVDLESGAVTVTADRELARSEVLSAVEEAGYALADA
jgi:copper chaperone